VIAKALFRISDVTQRRRQLYGSSNLDVPTTQMRFSLDRAFKRSRLSSLVSKLLHKSLLSSYYSLLASITPIPIEHYKLREIPAKQGWLKGNADLCHPRGGHQIETLGGFLPKVVRRSGSENLTWDGL